MWEWATTISLNPFLSWRKSDTTYFTELLRPNERTYWFFSYICYKYFTAYLFTLFLYTPIYIKALSSTYHLSIYLSTCHLSITCLPVTYLSPIFLPLCLLLRRSHRGCFPESPDAHPPWELELGSSLQSVCRQPRSSLARSGWGGTRTWGHQGPWNCRRPVCVPRDSDQQGRAGPWNLHGQKLGLFLGLRRSFIPEGEFH